MARFQDNPKRKPISKKLRFDIFKRDGFQCQYCGNVPPATVLELDHINPVSKGGDNSEVNLITSCFDCNRGKSNKTLDQVPSTLLQKQNVLQEREEQLKAYNRLLARIKARETRSINKVENIFREYHKTDHFAPPFKESIRRFLKKLPQDDIDTAMHLSGGRYFRNPDRTLKYFCGICWRMIEENNG